MAKVCPNCGHQLKDHAKFCGKCGSAFGEPSDNATKKPAPKNAGEFFKYYKNVWIGLGGLLAAIVLILIIVNPANSPNAVFGKYLDCMHSQNEQTYRAISYDANFSAATSADIAVDGYKARFSNADASYKDNGKTDLLKNTEIKVIKSETPKQSEIATRRNELKDSYRNTARITDIRNITFEIKQNDNKSTGTAELICVTGKWYIADVTGI